MAFNQNINNMNNFGMNNNMNMNNNYGMNNNMNMNNNFGMNNNMNNNFGMNMNNNFGMNNNMYMNNNYGMNNMNMNPNIAGQMFMQNMLNQVQQKFIEINNQMAQLAQQRTQMININDSTNNNSQNKTNDRLPRKKETVVCDPFAGYTGYRINVRFTTPAGNLVLMNAPINAAVYDLLKQYILKIQLGPNVINNGIYFICNGKKIKPEDMNKKVGDFLNDNVTIIVIDQKGLIGG